MKKQKTQPPGRGGSPCSAPRPPNPRQQPEGWDPKQPPPTAPPLPSAGFFLCAGLSLGKVDEDARRAGTEVAKGEHGRALLGCLLPFHHKHVEAVSAKG